MTFLVIPTEKRYCGPLSLQDSNSGFQVTSDAISEFYLKSFICKLIGVYIVTGFFQIGFRIFAEPDFLGNDKFISCLRGNPYNGAVLAL